MDLGGLVPVTFLQRSQGVGLSVERVLGWGRPSGGFSRPCFRAGGPPVHLSAGDTRELRE